MEPLEREFIPYREAVEIEAQVDEFSATLDNYDGDFELKRLCLELYESNLVKDRRMQSEESQEPQSLDQQEVIDAPRMILDAIVYLDRRLKNLSAFCGVLFILLMISILLR